MKILYHKKINSLKNIKNLLFVLTTHLPPPTPPPTPPWPPKPEPAPHLPWPFPAPWPPKPEPAPEPGCISP